MRCAPVACLLVFVTASPAASAETAGPAELLRAQRYEEALTAARTVLAGDPSDVDALAIAGNALFRLGRLDEAEDALHRALALDPSRPALNLQLGRIAMQRADAAAKRNGDEAESWFRRAGDAFDAELRATPGLGLALELRGLARARVNDPVAAVPALEAWLKASPDDIRPYTLLLDVYSRQKRWEEVARLPGRVPDELAGEWETLARPAARALLVAWRYAEADPLVARLGSPDGANDPVFWTIWHARAGNRDYALDCLVQILETSRFPLSGDALFARTIVSDVLLVASLGAERPLTPEEATGGPALNAFPDDVAPPIKLHEVKPEYPKAMEHLRKRGVVVVNSLIPKDGVPIPYEIAAATDTRFSGPAVDALRQWRFEPARRLGEPVPVMFKTVFIFRR